jgi:Tfp pilus assembly protein PilN
MIKINLLGNDSIASGRSFLGVYLFVASIVATLGIGWLLLSSISTEQADLNREKQQLEGRLKQLEEVTKEVRELEASKKLLDDKLSVIAKLRLSKQGPVRLFDDLNVAMPSNLWITELKESKGVLEIKGLALDDSGIVDFMKSLESSEYIRVVELGDSTQVYLVRVVDKSENSTKAVEAGRGQANQARAKSGKETGAIAHKVLRYEALSKEQRDAFDRDKFGAGVKLRSFTVKATVAYIGKTALKAAEEAAKKAEEEKKKAAAADATAAAAKKKKPAKDKAAVEE